MQEQHNTFKHYMENNKEVINQLKLKLIELKGLVYICADNQLPQLESLIRQTEKNIKFNQMLVN